MHQKMVGFLVFNIEGCPSDFSNTCCSLCFSWETAQAAEEIQSGSSEVWLIFFNNILKPYCHLFLSIFFLKCDNSQFPTSNLGRSFVPILLTLHLDRLWEYSLIKTLQCLWFSLCWELSPQQCVTCTCINQITGRRIDEGPIYQRFSVISLSVGQWTCECSWHLICFLSCSQSYHALLLEIRLLSFFP